MATIDGAGLRNAAKRAKLTWNLTEEHWRDQVRDQFREQHLDPLLDQIERTLREMGRLNEILARADKECRP